MTERSCIVVPRDLRELEALNFRLVVAKNGDARLKAQIDLIRFIEDHPTLIPFLVGAGEYRLTFREEKARH